MVTSKPYIRRALDNRRGNMSAPRPSPNPLPGDRAAIQQTLQMCRTRSVQPRWARTLNRGDAPAPESCVASLALNAAYWLPWLRRLGVDIAAHLIPRRGPGSVSSHRDGTLWSDVVSLSSSRDFPSGAPTTAGDFRED
ncbi:unnamed protein product [Gadus morhua 'NCC']